MPNVQFFERGPSRGALLSSVLGEAIGQGLGELYGSYSANKSLEKVLDDKSLEDAPLSERYSKLEAALRPHGERGRRILQNRLGIEQQRAQEKEQNVLARMESGENVSPEEVKNLSVPTQLKYHEKKASTIQANQIKQALLKAGYPEETADLWANQVKGSTVEGRSDTLKNVNDLLRRSQKGKGITQQEEPKIVSKAPVEIPGISSENLEMNFPELPEPVGMTSADIVKQNEINQKVNVPLYSETINTLNSLDEDYRIFQEMGELAESGKLSSGAGKWNVDWDTGELRFPALASPEEQLYVKHVSRLLNRAKEYFPGRVTNFDLAQFQKQFPTLANSPEGRKVILKELELANRIASLREESLKTAIDHYGSNADPHLIQKYANENYRKLKPKLENELKSLNKQAFAITTNQNIPENKIKVKTPDGQVGTILREHLEDAQKEGYELIQ